MFFIISKTLYYIAMPAVWMAVLLLYALFVKNSQRKRFSLIAVTCIFFVFSNNFIVNQIVHAWEEDPIKIDQLENHDLCIILTGVTLENPPLKDRAFFNKGADRVLHPIQLYKMGKIKKILISGGSGNVVGEKRSESYNLKSVLRYAGVSEADIILEVDSRNTSENALFSKKIIDSLNTQKILLVTSAFHMKRAYACFKKAGIQCTPFACDYYYKKIKYTPDYWIIPSEEAFSKSARIIHEIIGYITYKILGYC